ncbi:MAG: hypothetical protein IKS94_00160 [Prevotella sp.]|nr:hypothetical protein [Prevotella sp.]
MNRAQKILMMSFVMGIALTLAMAVAGEMNWLPVGKWQGNSNLEFIVLTVMELALICLIPLALRLFKFKKIKQQLVENGEPALIKWGLIRLDMLIFPMFLNTLFYYLFGNNSFGVMAVILLLSLFFVYPSKKRCKTEVEP